MKNHAITAEMSLLEVTEEFPATLDVFLANGFSQMANPEKRRAQGARITLGQALALKGKSPEAFISLLNKAVDAAAAPADLTLAEADPGEEIFPRTGDIRVAGLLPCPVRIPLLEAFEQVKQEVEAEGGLQVGVRLAAASVGADALNAGMQAMRDEGDLPDVFLSAGFEAFFDRRNMARFKERGVFTDLSWPQHNALLAPYELRDPAGHYSLLGVVPAVFLVDRTQLAEGQAPPRNWGELLDPALAGRVALPVGDFDLFNGILLTVFKHFGEAGVTALGRNLQQGLHPSQAAGRFAARSGQGPLVSVIPFFFSRMAALNPHAEIVWPEDGAIISPIFMLLKAAAPAGARRLASFFASREVGEILAHKGLFPSCHPEVENPVPGTPEAPAPFLWLGWDFIRNNDLGELIPRVNQLFNAARD